MLCLDKQVRANALCASQTRKFKLTEQTMVGVLTNEGIDVQKKEGNAQPSSVVWCIHNVHSQYIVSRILRKT